MQIIGVLGFAYFYLNEIYKGHTYNLKSIRYGILWIRIAHNLATDDIMFFYTVTMYEVELWRIHPMNNFIMF